MFRKIKNLLFRVGKNKVQQNETHYQKMAKKVADLVAEYNAIKVPRKIKIIVVK